jgi:hypothetical protein
MQLLEALVPLKIHWSALFSPRFGLDGEFLDLAKRSGLLHVNMGIESISQSTLKTMNKEFNRSQSYEDMIENLNERNIRYSFNFVFGTDTDDLDVFPTTLKFLLRSKVPAAYFNFQRHGSPARHASLWADEGGRDGSSTSPTWSAGPASSAISGPYA